MFQFKYVRRIGRVLLQALPFGGLIAAYWPPLTLPTFMFVCTAVHLYGLVHDNEEHTPSTTLVNIILCTIHPCVVQMLWCHARIHVYVWLEVGYYLMWMWSERAEKFVLRMISATAWNYRTCFTASSSIMCAEQRNERWNRRMPSAKPKAINQPWKILYFSSWKFSHALVSCIGCDWIFRDFYKHEICYFANVCYIIIHLWPKMGE